MLKLLKSAATFRAFFITLTVLLTLEMIAAAAICRYIDDLSEWKSDAAHVIQLPPMQITP